MRAPAQARPGRTRLTVVALAAAFTLAAKCGGSDDNGCGRIVCVEDIPPKVDSVSVNPATGVVVIGRTLNLTPNVSVSGTKPPARTVQWASSNAAIADVSDAGVVTGKAEGGPVTITATATADPTKSATAQVRVTRDSTGITIGLGSPTASVRQGATATVPVTLTRGPSYVEPVTLGATAAQAGLTASIAPASLSGTTLTATLTVAADANLAAGTYPVVVRGSGQTAVPNEKTLSVTVTPRVARVEVTLDDASIVEQTTTRAHARTLDTRGAVLTGRTVTWSSSDQAVATVLATEGLVSAVKAGTVYIRALVVGEAVVDSARLTVTSRGPVSSGPTMTSFSFLRNGYLGDSLTGRVTGLWGVDSANFFASSGNFVRRFAGGKLRDVYQLSTTNGDSIAIFGSAPDNVYAVGLVSRNIARFDGTQWATVTPPSTLTQVLSDVWVGPDSGLVVGRGGTILRLRGRTATEMSSGTTADLYAVWGFADGTAVAAGAAGTVLRFDGTRWNAITGAGATDVFSDVWGTSARDFFAVVRGGRVFRYNGTALTGVPALGASETGSPSIRLSGTSNENLYAAGFGVYAFDAASWSMIAVAPITGTSAGSLFATPNDLLYGTFYGGVFARRTRTSPWRPLVLAPIHRSVWVAPSGRAYVGSEAGRLVRIDGSAFEDLPSDSARQTPIHGVWSASSENEIHAVGNRFLGVYDGGRLRSARPTTVTTRNYYAVHGSAANNVFAVGTGIARFDGTSWSEVVIPGAAAATDTLADVWVVSPTFAVAVGSVGSSQVLKWDGTQWTRETIPFAGISAQSVYSTGPNAIFVGSADGRVFRWDGRTWAADMVGAGTTCRITDIWGKDASDVYVTTACGDIHAWNGTGWSRPFDGPVNTTLYSIYGVPGIGGIAVGSGAITVRGRP